MSSGGVRTRSPRRVIAPRRRSGGDALRLAARRGKSRIRDKTRQLTRKIAFDRGPGGLRRQLALTFDGGPRPLTVPYLDVLDRAGCRATFFLMGRACRQRPADVLEVVRRGHAIGWLGESGRPFSSLLLNELELELDLLDTCLPPSPGRTLVRPPGGGLDLRTLVHCALNGCTAVRWSVDASEGLGAEADADADGDPHELVRRLDPARLRPGDVIRLREGSQVVLDALPAILRSLKEANYALVTATELFESE